VLLATGFTALHLKTFLQARLHQSQPQRKFVIRDGLFGDLQGTLERALTAPPDYAVVVIEWPDVDARLALRSLGSWDPQGFPDILASARARLQRLQSVLLQFQCPTVVCPPTIELPPIMVQPSWQCGGLEASLEAAVSEFVSAIEPKTRIAGSRWLDFASPVPARYDVKSDMVAGFPYSLAHADAVAEAAVRLLLPRPLKKGIITDLDDTLWRGILGEDGVSGVSWELDRNSHMHAAYQRLLCSLSQAGVLVGVASKNDPALVAEVFSSREPLIPAERIFPIEASWGAKSDAVSRILKKWKVGADSVVFVDDSPMELAEASAAHPGLECLQFPARDHEIYALLGRLRDLFGKQVIVAEDRLRAESLRVGEEFATAQNLTATDPTDFLRGAEAVIQLSFDKQSAHPRALELINKTNQFNLNGRRLIEKDFREYLAGQDAFLMVARYSDKYGPLGQIAVVLGRRDGAELSIGFWVMSCRAFSRRIEHACLAHLFAKYNASAVRLSYSATERNGPLREFLCEFLDQPLPVSVLVQRDLFEARCPELPQRIEEVSD
jgi:FkbH-like protein